MFCDKCGKSIDDDLKFCPNCGTLLNKAVEDESGKSDEQVGDSKGKHSKIILFILAVVVVAITSAIAFFVSPTGRVIIADKLITTGGYKTSIKITENLDGEKYIAKNDYYKLFEQVEMFSYGQQVLYNFNDYDENYDYIYDMYNSAWGHIENAKGEKIHYVYEAKIPIKFYDDLKANLQRCMEKSEYLSDEQNQYLKTVYDCLNKDGVEEDVEQFKTYLTETYQIYEIAEYISDGNEFNPRKYIEKIENCDSSLNSASAIYKKYSEDDFTGYSELRNTISYLKKSLDKVRDYTVAEVRNGEYKYPQSPFNKEEDLDKVANNIRLISSRKSLRKAF